MMKCIDQHRGRSSVDILIFPMNNLIINIRQEMMSESTIDVKVINVHEGVVPMEKLFEIVDCIQELMR